jgi:hypothetical protein
MQLQHLFSGESSFIHVIFGTDACASQNGYLWIFPVPEKDLIIEAGTEKALHAYEFAMRGTKHLVRSSCPLGLPV